jgi:uncharacterized protein YggE
MSNIRAIPTLLLTTLSATAASAQPMAMPPMAHMPPVPHMMMLGTRLDVTGEGRIARAPDIARISAGVVTQAPTAAAAMADNARRMAATMKALRAAGIAERDLRTASMSLSPQYRYVDNQPPVITGYQVSNQLLVRFRDIARAGAILDTLVAQGANQISGPDFSIDDPAAALDAARTAAITDARARAEIYAKAAGLAVKRIISISESGGMAPQPMPMVMMARSAKEADTQIAPGEQDVAVSVSVSFELQ